MKGRLSVRVQIPASERTISPTDLEFTKSAYGGYTTCSFSTDSFVNSLDPALSAMARIKVDDTRTARRVWEGYLDLPGKTAGESGQQWRTTATGPASILADRSLPHIVVDADLAGWYRKSASAPGSTAEIASLPADEDTPALLMQFPAGQPIINNSTSAMRYDRILASGQHLGSIQAMRISGVTSSNYSMQFVVQSGIVVDQTFSTTAAGPAPRYFWTHIGIGETSPTLRIIRSAGGATTVATDTIWGAFYDVCVRPVLLDKNGTEIPDVYSDAYVTANQVITDALLRFTSLIDTANATIDPFTFQITQMAYPDPVRFTDILSDLRDLESQLRYGVYESNAAGLHRAEFVKWPTGVRYEVSTSDGDYSQPGGESDLRNGMTVSYVDNRGNKQIVTATGVPVAELDQWGRDRDADPVDLGTEVGNSANANQVIDFLVGQALLGPSTSASMTVVKPIRDLYLGREVWPWEIEPGFLVNVRDVDGPALQLTETTYRDSDASCSLTLGEPVLTTEQVVGRLHKTRKRN